MDDLSEVSPRSTLTELRTVLGCFLFGEDEVFKTIGVLSGGERNRYALARMLMQPSNFMLLDEPTNHLDIRAKDVLLESLSEYTGTVVFVSHDRYFVNKLATRVFEVADGEVRIYSGNYEDYLRRKESAAAMEAATEAEAVPDTAPEAASTEVSKAKRLNPIKLRQMQDRCTEIEEEVARREAEIAGYEAELADFKNAEETQRLMGLVAAGREALEALMREWEEISREIEENQ